MLAARDRFGFLLAAGLVGMFFFHILVNVGHDDRHHADHGHSAAVRLVRRLGDTHRLRGVGILLNIHSQRDRDVLGNA